MAKNAKKSLSEDEILSCRSFPKFKNGKLRHHRAINRLDGLKVGDEVLVYCFDQKYQWGTIMSRTDGELYADFESSDVLSAYSTLEFCDDSRNCWVSSGYCYINLLAISRVEFTR